MNLDIFYREIQKIKHQKSLNPLMGYIKSKLTETDELYEYLNFLSYYDLNFDPSESELDDLYILMGPLTNKMIPFGVFLLSSSFELFKSDEYNFNYVTNKLFHKLFLKVQNEVRIEYIISLCKYKMPKNKVCSAQLDRVLNISTNQFINDYKGDAIINYFTRQLKAMRVMNDEQNPLLCKINQQIKAVKDKYGDNSLFQFDFSPSEIEEIRKAQFLNLTGDTRGKCLSPYDKALITLVSISCFIEEPSEYDEKKFYDNYHTWLSLNDSYKNTTLQRIIKQDVSIIINLIGLDSKQYVSTFYAHAIITNRENTLNKTCKLFQRVCKHTGYSFSDEELIKENFIELLYRPKFKYIFPDEVIKAYELNPDITINFLLEFYRYFEINFIQTLCRESIINDDVKVPERKEYLVKYIDSYIEALNNDSTRAMVERSKGKCFEKPYLSYKDGKLQIVIGLLEVSETKSTEGTAKLVIYNEDKIFEYELTVTDSTINNDYIEVEDLWWTQAKYSIYYEEDLEFEGQFCDSLIFNKDTGRQLLKIGNVAQSILVLGTKNEVIMDSDSYEIINHNDKYNLDCFSFYIDEDNYFIYRSKLYGVSGENERVSKSNSFADKSLISDLEYNLDGHSYPIYDDFPLVKLILPISKIDKISITVSGQKVSYTVLEKTQLLDYRIDSSSESMMYILLKLDKEALNGTLYTIIILSEFSIVLEGTLYILKEVSFDFVENLYISSKDVRVNSFGFQDKENLLKGKYYSFPRKDDSTKYKIRAKDNEFLSITPPLFEIYREAEFVNRLNPDEFYIKDFDKYIYCNFPLKLKKNFTLSLIDKNTGNTIANLKRRGNAFSIIDISTISESSVLSLVAKFNNDYKDLVLCSNLYTTPIITNIKQIFQNEKSIVKNKSMELGLTLTGNFFGNLKRNPQLIIFNAEKEILFQEPIKSIGSQAYYVSKNDIRTKIHSILIRETTIKRFASGKTLINDYQCPFEKYSFNFDKNLLSNKLICCKKAIDEDDVSHYFAKFKLQYLEEENPNIFVVNRHSSYISSFSKIDSYKIKIIAYDKEIVKLEIYSTSNKKSYINCKSIVNNYKEGKKIKYIEATLEEIY